MPDIAGYISHNFAGPCSTWTLVKLCITDWFELFSITVSGSNAMEVRVTDDMGTELIRLVDIHDDLAGPGTLHITWPKPFVIPAYCEIQCRCTDNAMDGNVVIIGKDHDYGKLD